MPVNSVFLCENIREYESLVQYWIEKFDKFVDKLFLLARYSLSPLVQWYKRNIMMREPFQTQRSHEDLKDFHVVTFKDCQDCC